MSNIGVINKSNKVPEPEHSQDVKTNPTQRVGFMVSTDDTGIYRVLEQEIKNIIENRSYKTLAKLAASFGMTVSDFRVRCLNTDMLSNIFNIYNGVYVEDIMTSALAEGKVNAQTERWLKDEMQAYTGTGYEQHITFIDGDPDIEIEPDVDKEKSSTTIMDMMKNNE